MNLKEIIDSQHEYFNSHQTFDVDFRLTALKKLEDSIEAHKQELFDAFIQDLNKTEYDVYLTEISVVMDELRYLQKNLKKLTKSKGTALSLTNFYARGKIVPEPYGVCLIVSPWNYPFQLSMVPLIGAISAGNTAVLKLSSSVPNVSAVIKDILSVFEEKYVVALSGSREEMAGLFDEPFDFAFFTGSAETGKQVLTSVSKNLTPTVLELGGKSPCIIDYDADINLAVKKAVWGKFLNAGQTCVAPDYFLVHETIKKEFIQKVIAEIKKHYYLGDVLTQDFVKIVNSKQKAKIERLLDNNKKVVFGGEFDGDVLCPTVMDEVTDEDPIMQEEVFAPIMPIVSFTTLDQELIKLRSKPRPLALYYFSKDRAKQNYVISTALYGGGAINDTVVHVADRNLPFGGVGQSGMGRYHGKKTFETFSHYKSVLVNNSKIDIGLKYMPYSHRKLKKLKRFLKQK